MGRGEIRWYVDDVLYAYQRDSVLTYGAKDGAASGLSRLAGTPKLWLKVRTKVRRILPSLSMKVSL